MTRLTGRTAVVVGGATGWGRAAAGRLAQEGADVVVVDSAGDVLDAAVLAIAAIGAAGTKVQAIAASPSSWDELRDAAEACEAQGVTIDILVNNHMILDWASIEECEIESFRRVLDHNVVGLIAATKAFLPFLKRSDHGAIVNLGSIDGIYGNPRVPSYSASKGSYVPLTHVMSREFARYDIRVNAIASGSTNQPTAEDTDAFGAKPTTPGWERYPGPAYAQQLADEIPLKRYGTPEEWAGAVAFLASDDASYVSGAVLVVDCGRTGITPGTE
jgi:NAD(P)-dependent dehydrogenase (short-subunit alcohol dehydrogenase family)